MRKPAKIRRSMLLTLAAPLLAIPLGACAEQGFDPAFEVATPSATLAFANINPAIRMADAYGDKGKGAHGTFGKFPANFVTPEHTHTGAYHGVVIEGVMTNPFGGDEAPPELSPGSYWYVPAGAPHATACVSDTPCQFYFHAEKAFDFHPVE